MGKTKNKKKSTEPVDATVQCAAQAHHKGINALIYCVLFARKFTCSQMHADEFTDCPNVSTSKGNRREKFMRQSTEHKHSLTCFVCFSMADKRKRLQNEISSIYFIFCVQSFGAQFVNFNVLMRILRLFFTLIRSTSGPYRCTAFSLPVSLIIAFFVVNFPLILTDNFLLKSKLSRFPSHSIRFRMYLDYND